MKNHTQRLLTQSESSRLGELESVIDQGKAAFVEVGLALAEIRDSRLYRTTHKSFEDYCREKWSFTKTYANNLIDGASVVKSLPEKMTTMVVNERQSRELAKVEPERRAEVLGRAASSGPVTAKAIKEASSISEPQDKPRVVSGVQAEYSETSSETPPALDYASELIDLAEAALMKAPMDQLQRIATYAAILPRKAKEAIRARK